VVAGEPKPGGTETNANQSSAGGDRIPARLMRGDLFEFTPQFKLMVKRERPVAAQRR